MSLRTLARWVRATAPEADPTQPRLRSTGRTHVGLVRTINEDRVLDMPEHRLWAIADGMGGHSAGDLAAEAAVNALRAVASGNRISATTIEAALAEVNRELYGRSLLGAPVSGATIVAMFEQNRALTFLWAGDCRAYRLRDGQLAQLTHDHTVVQEMVDSGVLDAERAPLHPRAHVVTRALGADKDLRLDRATSDVRARDIFLLCSDGLTTAPAILTKLIQAAPNALASSADTLIADALASGGKDNISLLLIEVD